jgi:hypothetical protein
VIERARPGERRCDGRLIGDVQHQGVRGACADFVARGVQAVLIPASKEHAPADGYNATATARPIPDAPPVIITRLPASAEGAALAATPLF